MIAAGVDTHKDLHVACVLDEDGRVSATGAFSADEEGYAALAAMLGAPRGDLVVGVEGTATYGAGLFRHLASEGYEVREVLRPGRAARRHGQGKSDAIDAERAARDVLSGERLSVPKSQDGFVEQLRLLNAAREQAVGARSRAAACAKSLVVTAPSRIREWLGGMSTRGMMRAVGRTRSRGDAMEDAALASLRALASLWLESDSIAAQMEERMRGLLEEHAAPLIEAPGCGVACAAKLLLAVGDNPGRVGSEAAFAALCGVAPLPASSGRVDRHRLSRAGNRQANSALYMIAIVRMKNDERTRKYIDKCISRGKSKKEAIRCLKRYIAREMYGRIKACEIMG